MKARGQTQRLLRLGLLSAAAIALAATWRVTNEIRQRAEREEVLGLVLLRAQGQKKPASSLEKLRPLVASSQPLRDAGNAAMTLDAVFTPPPTEPEQASPPPPPPPPACKTLVVPLLQVQALGERAAVLNDQWTRVGEPVPVTLPEHPGVRRAAVLDEVGPESVRIRCGRERFDVAAPRGAH